MTDLARRALAEALGTAGLSAAVVGSGVMAARLTDDVGLTLLVNALATVAALGVLIATLLPVSGAHLNPAVTLVAAARRELGASVALVYVGAQLVGGVGGVVVAHAMFSTALVDSSSTTRSAPGLWLGEFVATAGLLFVIGMLVRTGRVAMLALAVPAWIGAAYFFTASTSFANPAVTVARSMTDTFAGIAPVDVPAFVVAQLLGAMAGAATAALIDPGRGSRRVESEAVLDAR